MNGAGRHALLISALGFARLELRETTALRRWLGSWPGVGAVVVGMLRPGYRLSLSNVSTGEWCAAFMSSPLFAPDRFGVAAAPWTALQRAAWVALMTPRL